MFPGHPHFPHKPFTNSQPLRPGQPGYNPHQIHQQHFQAGSLINAQKHEAMHSTSEWSTSLFRATTQFLSASFSSSSPTLASSAVRVLDDSVEPPPETSVNPRIIRGWADGMQGNETFCLEEMRSLTHRIPRLLIARMANVNALAVVVRCLHAEQIGAPLLDKFYWI